MTKFRYTLSVLIILFGYSNVFAQIENDVCRFATFLPDTDDFWSAEGAFTNVGSTFSGQEVPFCWDSQNEVKDVWFSYRPKNLASLITMTGENGSGLGTLTSPSLVIYSGTCGNLTELACNSVVFNENRIELSVTDLIIGRTYYIRASAEGGNDGSFQLCVSTFAPTKAPQSDCDRAVVLCSKDPFFIEQLIGRGDVSNEVDPSTCLRVESNSVWYKWVVDKSGTLSFDLLPNNGTDDLDFALYTLPGGLDDCDNKVLVRCMASGETQGQSNAFNQPCFGETGIGRGETDVSENPGCGNGSNNYVSEVDMVSGETYLLLVNNFSASGFGFSIEFGGTGTFLGADPDFEVESVGVLECDKIVQFSNMSVDSPDSIVSYQWSFGHGSSPGVSNDFGPIDVSYESFGDKTAALTLESKRGCIVTKTVDFYVEPCCKDTSTLAASVEAFDLRCFGINEGRVLGQGINGAPNYEYRLGNGAYKPNPQFSNLSPGEYEIFVRDIKGCEVSTNATIISPPEIMVEAGEDQFIDLGNQVDLFGEVGPSDNYTFDWFVLGGESDSSLSNYNILDPTAFPCETSTYILRATNANLCTAEDTISITVSSEYVIHSPNIIKVDTEDKFNLFGNDKAISHINQLYIYDRWGNLVYEGNNLDINNPNIGWDGQVNGRPVSNGVYTWLANVEFLCGVTPPPFKGNITVIR